MVCFADATRILGLPGSGCEPNGRPERTWNPTAGVEPDGSEGEEGEELPLDHRGVDSDPDGAM